MTRDSGRHAQRGDVQQAPPEGCQSVIAQRIPTSPPIGTDQELIAKWDAAIQQIFSEHDDWLRNPTDEEARWAVAQLVSWPTRLHEDRTTNDRFLRLSVAAQVQSRISEVERLRVLLDEFCKAAELDGDPAYAHLIIEGRAALSQQGKV